MFLMLVRSVGIQHENSENSCLQYVVYFDFGRIQRAILDTRLVAVVNLGGKFQHICAAVRKLLGPLLGNRCSHYESWCR